MFIFNEISLVHTDGLINADLCRMHIFMHISKQQFTAKTIESELHMR